MTQSFPLVSVIMPVRNEADFIAEALNAVVAQDYPRDRTEIIICDGMSTDATRKIVAAFQAEYANILLLDNPQKIAPTALNIAASASRGEIIIRVDGHCVIAPTYISRSVDHLRNNPEVWGVGGPIETIALSREAEPIAIAMSSKFGVGGSAFRTIRDKTLLVDTVAFPAYRREAVDVAGPYDEQLVRNQDDEYNFRIREMGGKILLAADIQSTYYSRGTLSKLWRQYFQYGFYKTRVMQKHPRQMSPRQFVPAAFVLSVCLAVMTTPWTSLPLILLLGIYVLAVLSATAIVCAQRGWKHGLLLPLAFSTLHLSYGSGFILGLCTLFPGGARTPANLPG
jgi:cellulose synthase/poly-beta-1,6-N-acetylglucosamine synthase-like glycosyltransferase